MHAHPVVMKVLYSIAVLHIPMYFFLILMIPASLICTIGCAYIVMFYKIYISSLYTDVTAVKRIRACPEFQSFNFSR